VTDQHRHVVDADVEPIEHLLDLGVPIEIQIRVRMAVSAEELLDAKCSRRMSRPNQDRISQPLRDELDSPQQERAHQDFTELGIRLHERQDAFAIDFNDVSGAPRSNPKQRSSAGNHVDLSGELTGREPDHWRLRFARDPDDFDLACAHDEQRHDVIACFDKDFAFTDAARTTVRRKPGDLSRCQRREHLLRAPQLRWYRNDTFGHDRQLLRVNSRQRRVHQMFGEEPGLHLVLTDDLAHEEIVRSVIASLRRFAGHRPRLLEHDLVRVEQP
jgi:hypothetical protein